MRPSDQLVAEMLFKAAILAAIGVAIMLEVWP